MAAEDERGAALAEIRRLMVLHAIAPEELRDPQARAASGGVLPRVLAYLGGVFLCAGVAAFVSLNWDVFPPAGRVLLTLGLGLSLFVAACALPASGRWESLVAPLLLLAELLQPAGMLVAFEEHGGGGDERIAFLLTAAVFGAQALLVQQMRPHAVLMFFALLHLAWALSTTADLLGLEADLSWCVIGASLVLLAQGLDATRYRNTVRTWTLIGSVAFYAALFSLVEGGWQEALFVLACAGGVYLSVVLVSQTLLLTAILALLGYISYFTAAYFSDALGWPLVLVLIGVALLGLGRLGLQLRTRLLRPPAD